MAKKESLHLGKLIDATNVEGEKNEKVFEITKHIERELSQFPEFIGVVPFGSRTKGYADEHIFEPKTGMIGSDYDVFVFELGKISNHNENLQLALEKIGISYSHRRRKIQFIFQFLDLKYLFDLLEMVDHVDIKYLFVQFFANLCRPGRGKKIGEWRNVVKAEILKQPKETQEKVLQLFIDFLVYSDRQSLPKIRERVLYFNSEEYMESRRKLWTRRVCKIYGSNS